MVEEDVEEVSEEITEEPKKEKEMKRAVRKRKSKKEKESPLAGALRLTVESGKVEFGTKTGIKNSLVGNAKLLVLAGNAPAETRESALKYTKASSIPLIEFEGSSIELGSICGKPFPVAVLTVYEQGNSNLLELAKKK